MLTAQQIVNLACIDAKLPGANAPGGIGQIKLQVVLDEICQKNDFASSRGEYLFFLQPTVTQTINGVTNFGGPYVLPLDYLRVSGSSGSEGVQFSFFYYYLGQPYMLVPFDLGKGDKQVQQPGIQNFPYAYWTDISTESTAQDRIAGFTTASTTSGQAAITVGSTANMLVGMGVSGRGIAPASTILSIVGLVVTLSLPATGTFVNVSILFGTPPNVFVYPGPSTAFPSTLRYQRLMPPIVDFSQVPWFPDQQYLIKKTTADIMNTTDDSRYESRQAEAMQIMGKYSAFADDKTSRAQTVLLDRNRFGRRFDRLNNTKTIGW